MAQHKWHKEIKAWADGAEIEGQWQWGQKDILALEWCVLESPDWDSEAWIYRIKPQPSGCLACVTCGQLVEQPQPKEPQYLYVYEDIGGINITSDKNYATKDMEYIGKIKLEQDDE